MARTCLQCGGDTKPDEALCLKCQKQMPRMWAAMKKKQPKEEKE